MAASAAILVLAPGRFSMMNGWPSRSESHWPMRRAVMSDAPPAAKPTMMRTGRVGYSCAHAGVQIAGAAIATAADSRNLRRCIIMFALSHVGVPSTLRVALIAMARSAGDSDFVTFTVVNRDAAKALQICH